MVVHNQTYVDTHHEEFTIPCKCYSYRINSSANSLKPDALPG